MPTTAELLRLHHRSFFLDPSYSTFSNMAATATNVKHRDPTWIPPPCSSTNSDLHNDPDVDEVSDDHHQLPTNSTSNNTKIGESFLSDVHSVVLNPHSTCTGTNVNANTNTTASKQVKSTQEPIDTADLAQQQSLSTSPPPVAPPPPTSITDEERRYTGVDSSDQPRDLQSDLFLLDQAMQAQPTTRHDSLMHHQTAASSMNMAGELEASDSLFGDALGRSAFSQPLFDDHKLLSFDSNVDTQTYSRLPAHPIVATTTTTTTTASQPTTSLPSHHHLHRNRTDAAHSQEPQELESILHELGIINSQQERDFIFAKDNGLRPFHSIYGQDVHLPGSMTFGRQKKRRLSSITLDTAGAPVFPEGYDAPMAKRAKSEIPSSTGGLYYGERPTRPSGYGTSIGGMRTGGRAYTVMNGMDMNRSGMHGHFSDSGGPDMTTRTNTDLYENLSPELQMRVDHLREKIAKMPRRKLRESLAKGVTIDEVIPLMSVNRDDLAEMLGLGVTTWKIFIHNTFGIPRWPARVLKSQETREQSLRGRLRDAELRGDTHTTQELWQELKKLEEKRKVGRNKLRALGRRCREKLIAKLSKGNSAGAAD